MDPFAVAQCVSVVHGKLCYEGKLIAAVLEAKLGVSLEYDITGQGDTMKVVVGAAIDGKPVVDSKGKAKTVEGTVGDWKTTGTNSPWSAKGGHQRMLRYRGAREWARIHAPSIRLGVYSDDEMDALYDERRGRSASEVIMREEPPAPPAPPSIAAPAAPTLQPPPEETQDLPNPATDPEAFRKWADEQLAALDVADDLERTFIAKIAPHEAVMFPPDCEDIIGLYRKHERRLVAVSWTRLPPAAPVACVARPSSVPDHPQPDKAPAHDPEARPANQEPGFFVST